MRRTQDTTVSSQYKSLIMNIFIVAPQKGSITRNMKSKPIRYRV